MKVCTICSRQKPTAEFTRDKYRPDGLTTHCKQCRVKHARAYRASNLEKWNKEEPRAAGSKFCTICKKKKDISKFVKDRTRGDGFRSTCNSCLRSIAIRKYGLTEEEYGQLLEKADLCMACLAPLNPEDRVIDHCHTSGYVRGIIHRTCNLAIGLFLDDPTLLRNAADFIEKSAQEYENLRTASN